MNIVMITGASSGLGNEFAKQMDGMFQNIDEFWLIARRKERLEELSTKLKVKTRILPLDMTAEESILQLEALLRKENPVIRVLVNCAGYGILGALKEGKRGEQAGMIDLNCKALMQMTHLCIPYMRTNSRIIQLASSAAFLPQSNFAVYAATKSFVLSFSRALGEELLNDGIYVTAVCPGPVKTEFFDIAQKYGEGMKIKELTLVTAPEVVKNALLASARKKTVTVYGGYMKAFWIFSKILPHSFLLKLTRFLR